MQITCGSNVETTKKHTTQWSGMLIVLGWIHWFEIRVFFCLPAHPSLTGVVYVMI